MIPSRSVSAGGRKFRIKIFKNEPDARRAFVFVRIDTEATILRIDRISVDSGVLNPDQLTKDYGEATGRLWAKARLRDRIDAIIVHEESEAKAGTHEEAMALAPQTTRPISEATRQILHVMERGWKR